MDEALSKRLNELALRAFHTGGPCWTRFLEPAWEAEVRRAAAAAGVSAAFWGGYGDAERRVAAFYGEDGAPAAEDYPLRALWITWNAKFAHPAHRDLLGAVMGLGLERAVTGDIAMARCRGEEGACLFALAEVSDYLCANLESAGRAALKVRCADAALEILPPEGRELRLTVQQPRLDAVAAAVYRLSRAEAKQLITAGQVKLNHVPCLRPDAAVKAGDLISARGFGRARLTAFAGESRRGRLVVTAFRYGG